MQIVENKALLINAQDPCLITDNIHKSAEVAEGVVVKWGHNETEILAQLGFADTPSPMLKSYQWTGKFEPFKHQKTTASFLSILKRAFSALRRASSICSGDTLATLSSAPAPLKSPLADWRTQLPRLALGMPKTLATTAMA